MEIIDTEDWGKKHPAGTLVRFKGSANGNVYRIASQPFTVPIPAYVLLDDGSAVAINWLESVSSCPKSQNQQQTSHT